MTLTQLFTAIANAIRAKKGTSGTITASNFPTEIASITTGHLDNTEYTEANDDLDDILEGTTPVKIYPPDWSEIGYEDTPQNVIEDFNYAKTIYDNWDNTVTNLANKFENDTNLIILPLVDTSNATIMVDFCNGCTNLQNVAMLNTENVTNMALAFNSCQRLKHIPVLDTSKCINLNNFVQGTFELTNESLDNILQMCANSKSDGYIGTKTLYGVGLRNTYYSSATIQALPHYQDFINAGWTIGY